MFNFNLQSSCVLMVAMSINKFMSVSVKKQLMSVNSRKMVTVVVARIATQ